MPLIPLILVQKECTILFHIPSPPYFFFARLLPHANRRFSISFFINPLCFLHTLCWTNFRFPGSIPRASSITLSPRIFLKATNLWMVCGVFRPSAAYISIILWSPPSRHLISVYFWLKMNARPPLFLNPPVSPRFAHAGVYLSAYPSFSAKPPPYPFRQFGRKNAGVPPFLSGPTFSYFAAELWKTVFHLCQNPCSSFLFPVLPPGFKNSPFLDRKLKFPHHSAPSVDMTLAYDFKAFLAKMPPPPPIHPLNEYPWRLKTPLFFFFTRSPFLKYKVIPALKPSCSTLAPP